MSSYRLPAERVDSSRVVEYFAAHRVFGVLPRTDVCELAAQIVERGYRKGHYLFREADPPAHVFLLREGLVVLAERDERGHLHPILTFRAGDVFGLATTVLDIPRRANAFALVDATSLLIPKKVFDRLYRSFPPFGYQVANELAWILCRSERTTFTLTLNTVTARLARLLSEPPDLKFPRLDGPVPYGKLSHQDLALLLGTTRETVTRALKRLAQAGIIVFRGREIVVRNDEKLRRLAVD